MSSSSEERIAVKSYEGEVVYIKKTVAQQSLFIQRKIKLNQAGPPIDLELITTATLNKVVDYCNHQVEFADDKAALNSFEAQFVKIDGKTLFSLIHAAHFLKIYTLMNLTCQTLSDKIKGKNMEEMEEAVRNWRDNQE
ncbi:hypothetical protein POM88_051792 [Heracleum sosnowskyi]|uniref:SKP1-like protein n=1 Tax=Heracleum sosnowskyi TaxID=360622 RepID=A0AAD8H166_9APIA|nr:hypothetical protein POM88_051792 [Heracleum sosnowskyi]